MAQRFHGNYVVCMVGEKVEGLSQVSLPSELLWNKVTFLASLRAKVSGAFNSYSVGEVQRKWGNL